MPPSTSPWARDDTPPTMLDRVQKPTRRAKGDFTRNDFHFSEPWATDLKDAGVPPPGFFGNGWKHPEIAPRSVPPSTLPYATNFLELPHPEIALKPNQEKIYPSDFNQVRQHNLQSTSMAFLEKRAGGVPGRVLGRGAQRTTSPSSRRRWTGRRRTAAWKNSGTGAGTPARPPTRVARSSRSLTTTAAARSRSRNLRRLCGTRA
jgi:hypothetical protein